MKRRNTNKSDTSRFRIYLLGGVFLIIGLVVTARLFYLQVEKHQYYEKIAKAQHFKKEKIPAERGKILFKDHAILAKDYESRNVSIAPQEISEKEKTAKKTSSVLEPSKKEVLKLMNSDDVWISFEEDVPISKAEKLESLRGVYLKPTFTRKYPQGKLAAHLVGFCNKERKGQYGVEEYYQSKLKGEPGYWKGKKDVSGNKVPSVSINKEESKPGSDIVLTLDSNIQSLIKTELKKVVRSYNADGGSIIVADPETGEILGMSSRSSESSRDVFNPNKFSSVKEENMAVFKNPTVQMAYEPGSIFKPITMAGALEEEVVSPQTTYQDKGKVTIEGKTIRNADLESHGQKTMTEVLELSLNTGAVYVERQLGNKKFKEYVKKFGFGKKTGTEISGEVQGDIDNILSPPGGNPPLIEFATASFGQGITVTPAQIIKAFSTIANGGKQVTPHVTEAIISANGDRKEIPDKKGERVISSETASRLTAMLVSVVKNGYGEKAAVEGHLIAGKTGTAQVAGVEKSGYKSGRTIHSFVGYAPAFNPEFLILIKLDDPKGIRFSSDSIAPVFHNVAEYLFPYFGISPSPEAKN